MSGAAVNMREIGPGQWKRHRWDWLRSVRSADSKALNMTAKLIAHALVHDWTNAETGECKPSPTKLAGGLGTSVKTVERALRDLVAAGFIERHAPSKTGGRTHMARIVFLSRAQVVPINRDKSDRVSGKAGKPETGTNLSVNWDKSVLPPTPPKIDKPKKNQNAGARDGLSRFSALAVQTAQSYGPKIGRGERVHPCIFSEESIACILALDLATADQIAAAGLGDLLPKGQGNEQ